MLAMLLLNRMSMKRRSNRQKIVSKSVHSDIKSVTEYCRTCLNTEDLVLIFYSKETADKRSEDLKLVTGLEVNSVTYFDFSGFRYV